MFVARLPQRLSSSNRGECPLFGVFRLTRQMSKSRVDCCWMLHQAGPGFAFPVVDQLTRPTARFGRPPLSSVFAYLIGPRSSSPFLSPIRFSFSEWKFPRTSPAASTSSTASGRPSTRPRPSTSSSHEMVSPVGLLRDLLIASGSVVAKCPIADAAAVDRAVQTAHKAQREWGAMTALERGKVLRKVAETIRVSWAISSSMASWWS